MSRRSALVRQSVMIAIALVFYIWLVYYALTGDTGPIGWLNALQARFGGGYSRKLSLLALMVVGALPVSVVWIVFWPTDVPPPDPSVPRAKPMPSWLVGVFTVIVVESTIWGAAIGNGVWQAHEQNVDAAATYAPLVLSSGAPTRSTEGDHLAVRGHLLVDHVVTRTEGNSSEKMALVPLVEPGWKEGDQVHLLLSVEYAKAVAVREAMRSNGGVLLVKVEGAVPSAALDVFSRLKAPISDDARALAFVPSADGRPSAAPTELNWVSIAIPGWIGTGFVVLLAGLFVFMPVLERRAKRQLGREPGIKSLRTDRTTGVVRETLRSDSG